LRTTGGAAALKQDNVLKAVELLLAQRRVY